MAWILPPAELRARVAQAFGGRDPAGRDIYDRLAVAYSRALSQLPHLPAAQLKPISQYRAWTPKGVEGPVSARSLHLLGLARDVDWSRWTAQQREELARALTAAGLAVEAAGGAAWSPGMRLPPRHLHVAIPRRQVYAAGLRPLLDQLARAARAR